VSGLDFYRDGAGTTGHGALLGGRDDPDKLAEIINADPRTRDNMWAGVLQATKSLSNPNVLDACSPRPDFDTSRFLAESGTLYVIGDDKGVDGPLVAALIEDVFATAKRIANASPGNRLDPPLLLMLDEAANIAYLPSLPTMVSAGGGRGITTVNVWQSRAQARDRWGADAERAIWGASTVKIVLGGLSDPPTCTTCPRSSAAARSGSTV
jgi:type IV secretory pathway TraG/TraD family ATPase VirD4